MNRKNICFSLLVLSSILSSCGIKEISKEDAKVKALEIKEYLSSDSFVAPTKYTLNTKIVQNRTITSSYGSDNISLVVEETSIYDGDSYSFYSGSTSTDGDEIINTEVWLYGENNVFYTVISSNDQKVYFKINVEEGKMEETFIENYNLFGFMIDPTLLSKQSIEQTLSLIEYSSEDFENRNYKDATLKFKSKGDNELITFFNYKTQLNEEAFGMITTGNVLIEQQITFKDNMLFSSKLVEDSDLDIIYNNESYGKEISKKETNSSFNYSAKFVKPNLSEFVEKK